MTRRFALLLPYALVPWAVVMALSAPWGGDMRLHVATLFALRRDPWSPVDPLMGVSEGSPYFSPYAYVLTFAGWIGDLEPLTVLRAAGVLNIAFWLWALRRFCRRLGEGRAVFASAVLFCLLLWGLKPQAWSGFVGLYSLSWTMAYPSLFATALMLLAWDLFLDLRDERPGWSVPAALALLLALLVLIHPFTAVNTVLGLAAFALAAPRAVLRRWRLAPAAAGAVALALLWPFTNVTSLLGAPSGMAEIHWTLVDDLWADLGFAHYGLALVGLPALVARRARPLGREMLLLFGLAAAVLCVASAFGSWGFARVIPVAVLPLHLSAAAWLTEAGRHRRIMYPVTATACAVGLVGNQGGLTRPLWAPVRAATLAEWQSRDPATGYQDLVSRIRPGQVVAAETEWAGRVVNERGAYSLVPGWPYPFAETGADGTGAEAARRADSDVLFGSGTAPARRAEVTGRYGVACVLADLSSPVLAPGALPGFRTVSTAGSVGLSCRG
ncbi:hypothetical protein ABGB12_15590 [Actinocorallia sp. B10E7]|uniref:hypothetical protein n=1 Tax=Actinocorallia sp. B10E7 TaxID=3153558 RepID=UPI00325DD63A